MRSGCVCVCVEEGGKNGIILPAMVMLEQLINRREKKERLSK